MFSKIDPKKQIKEYFNELKNISEAYGWKYKIITEGKYLIFVSSSPNDLAEVIRENPQIKSFNREMKKSIFECLKENLRKEYNPIEMNRFVKLIRANIEKNEEIYSRKKIKEIFKKEPLLIELEKKHQDLFKNKIYKELNTRSRHGDAVLAHKYLLNFNNKKFKTSDIDGISTVSEKYFNKKNKDYVSFIVVNYDNYRKEEERIKLQMDYVFEKNSKIIKEILDKFKDKLDLD